MNVHLVADEKISEKWTIIVVAAQSISGLFDIKTIVATEPATWPWKWYGSLDKSATSW